MNTYQTIKQGFNDGACAACCVAMATRTTLSDVYQFLNDGRTIGDPICSADEAMYLLYHGWIRGGGWQIAQDHFTSPDTVLTGTILQLPALIDVESNNYPGVEHALFWDGDNLRDPDPRVPDIVRFLDYKILRIWPLTQVLEIRYCRRIQLRPDPLPLFVKEHREGRYTFPTDAHILEPTED